MTVTCDWVWRTDGYYAKVYSLHSKVFIGNIIIRVDVCLNIELKYTCVDVLKPMQ